MGRAVPSALLDHPLQVMTEGLAVQEAGELVVGRLVGELEGEQALFRDVLEDDDRAERPSGGVADGGAGALDGVAAAVPARQGDALGEAEAGAVGDAAGEEGRDVSASFVVELEDL